MARSIVDRLAAPAVLLGLLLVWQVYVALAHPPQFILPGPIVIAQTFVEILPALVRHTMVTVVAGGLGFVVGSVLGLVLAIVMSLVPAVRSAIYPIIIGSQTTPKIAFAPLLLVWFGIGLLPKVIIVALLAFFPVLINTLVGLDTTDRGFTELLRSVDAGRWEAYRKIRLPASIPFIFAGLKLALTVSVIGAIIAEWVASNEGLGFLLLFYNATLRTPELFAVLVALVLLTSVAFGALVLIERLLSWEARLNAGSTTAVRTAAATEANL